MSLLEYLDPAVPEGAFSIKSHFCLDYFELCFYHLRSIKTPASYAWKGLSESLGTSLTQPPKPGFAEGVFPRGCTMVPMVQMAN